MDEDDEFFDTISVGSAASRRRLGSRDFLNLSRNTVYYSAVDLGGDMEMTNLNEDPDNGVNLIGNDTQNKVSRNKKDVRTYSQWRDRRWRYFTSRDLPVDFVLAYHEQGTPAAIDKRRIFENNLQQQGLILEREENQRIHFVKIHVPKDVCSRYAAILKLRLPIKDDETFEPSSNIVSRTVDRILDCLNVRLDPVKFPERKYRLTTEFSEDKSYLFDVDSPNFFNYSVRITVAAYILGNEKFGNDDMDKGIERLISEGVYTAAYPLHDGDLQNPNSMRKLLLDEWASVSKCIKYQPIDEIKEYFGVKYALYFTWLGFYTHMLIPASLVGLICILYAATTAHQDKISEDICNLDIIMCPRCDKYCDYWKLSESCTYSKIQHYIDNPATIFFAVFMSIWAALYLELWKRYSAEVTHRWGLITFDLLAEPPRPAYLIRLSNAKKRKLNVITLQNEPSVPFWRVKLPSLIISFSVVFLWILLALAVVFGIVIYRMSLATFAALVADKASYRIYVLPVTAGLLNLVCIVILNFLYNKLAVWLTEMELQRTQTEYEDSLALKIYMFQFVNYYSSIFYIAFFKGKFVGYPKKYNKIFGYRQEECNPGGCLMELTIQLAIIMIGNQFINSVTEMILPLCYKLYKQFQITTGLKKAEREDREIIISCNQWTEDYKLSELESWTLFSEYLEMVLQYGFITIFVAAFPLAPFFALINNVLEMRLDAKKFLKYFRRPIPQRVKDIGVWLPIMSFIGRISVVSNAFIIAFSSHFIPLLVYTMKLSPNGTEDNFLNFTLAYFDTRDFNGTEPERSVFSNVTVCRYAEFRNPPPGPPEKYKRPLIYWHILAARLAFIVAYQNIVNLCITAVEWIIPDIPRKLNDQIKREAYRVNEIIIKNETERARELLRGSNGDITKQRRHSTLTNRSSRSTLYYDVEDS